MPTHGIRDVAPAARWEDAFLAGNGELGIMVFGDPGADRIVLNHHRFVLPNGTRDRKPPRLADRIERVRELILAGRRAEASALLAGGEPLRWTQQFHPGFVLTITGDPGPVRDYCRATDFTTGEISVGWSGSVRRRQFVSRADGVVVQHLAGADARVALSGDLPGRPAEVGYELTAYGKTGLIFLRARGTYPPGLGAHGFEAVTMVLGDASVTGDGVRVRGDALLLTAMARTDEPGRPTARLEASLAALRGHDYSSLLARHRARHEPAYRRVSLDLEVPPAESDLPVGELLARDAGPALLERLFHSGRYLLLSSSGVLPPRLTGLWLGEWGAAWSGDFTLDANLNLQMAAATIGNLPEVTDAYARLIGGQVADWRANARLIYGTRGLLAPSRTDGEHGHLIHYDADWPWAAWLPGADWLLHPLLERHLAAGDGPDELWGWLVEAAEFFAELLARTGGTIVPSFSAETGPLDDAGRPVLLAANATMDIAAARHALRTAGEVTGSARWDETLGSLPDYPIDESGALAEWAWPGYRTDDDHRHVSHLYPVWPLHEITPDRTPELAAAARRALVRRGDENLSAHGSLHRALVACRLRDAALAEANLRKIVGNDMFFRSLMSSHNPGQEIYNADAAHTLPGVLLEMLVDSRPGLIELLPALPGALPSGVLRGVLCRCRVVVEELRWSPGVVRAAFRAPFAQRVLVRTPYGAREVDLPGGNEPVLENFS